LALEGNAMTTVQLDLPTELFHLPNQTSESLGALAREALIVRLYDRGLVTAGWAAQTLELSRREFLDLLGSYRVSAFDEALDVAAEALHG
jgi:predicted HTH domain antitoxin